MILMHLKKLYSSPPVIVLEFLIFYVFMPFITIFFLEGWLKVGPLLLIAIYFLVLLLRDPDFDRSILFRFDWSYVKKTIPRMLVVTFLMLWFTGWIFTDLFFEYPIKNFEKYLVTFFFYPLISVLPQEIIYRVYFFHRYKQLIPEKYLLMLINAVIFGLTHGIYDNWIAPIATFLVSWIFIFNYIKTKSLLNVCLEHYYYGLIMFTVGLGYFFK